MRSHCHPERRAKPAVEGSVCAKKASPAVWQGLQIVPKASIPVGGIERCVGVQILDFRSAVIKICDTEIAFLQNGKLENPILQDLYGTGIRVVGFQGVVLQIINGVSYGLQ